MTKQYGEQTGSSEGVSGAPTRRFRRVRVLAPIAAAIGIVAACSTPGSSSNSGGGVSAPTVASSSLTTIGSGLRSQVLPKYDVGRMDADAPLTALSFRFRPSAAQKADRDAFMAAQQDPTSPSYHRWLTPDQ